jgi:hypothetical protein
MSALLHCASIRGRHERREDITMTAAWWTTLLINWMPFFVLVAAWLICTAIVSRRKSSNNRLVDLVEVQIAEMQRTNALLDRIAIAQEKRTAPVQNAN